MSSNIEIQKKCKWCGQIFIARKTSTNYCSHKCNNAAYKERIRQERIATYQKEISINTDISVPLKSGQININQTIPGKGKN